MAISLVANTSNNTNNVASMSLNVPSGTVDDDVIVFMGSCDGNSGWAIPSGFTAVQNVQVDSHKNLLAYKVASSEPASHTINVVTGVERGWGCFATYRGVDTSNVVDGSSSNTNTTANQTVTFTNLTPTVDDCMVVAFIGAQSGNNGLPIVTSWPSSITEQNDNVNGPAGSGNGSSSGAFGDILQTTATLVGSDAVIVGGNTRWGAMLLALTPAAGGSSPTQNTYQGDDVYLRKFIGDDEVLKEFIGSTLVYES